jgi:hypothetical protein
MTTSAKRTVDVTASGSDPEIVKRFLRQDGEVIGALLVM